MYSFGIFIVIVLLILFVFNKIKNRSKKNTALKIYSDSFGYRNDKTVQTALKRAQQEIKGGKDKMENAFVAAEILNFNVGDHDGARELYELALAEIVENPVAALQNDTLEPEAVIDRLEFALPREQEVLLRDALQNTRADINREALFDRRIRSDAQNVHDSSVTAGMRERYSKLDNYLPDYTGLLASMKNHTAHRVATSIIDNPAEMGSLNTTDAVVLGVVWARINDQRNADRREELIKSLEKSLENCANSGHTVCTVGRVSNILDSLTAIDSDSEIAQPVVTTEILRREVMQKAAHIVSSLSAAEKEIYDNDEHPEFEKFSQDLKQRMEETMKREFPPSEKLNDLIAEATAAI